MPKYHDLAIRWNENKSSVLQIMKSGSVSIHGLPQYFRPGKWVAIVSKGNDIHLMFKATSIKGPQRVMLANGNSWQNGYIIKADMKTIQQPKPSLSSPIANWPVIGAFGYFDKSTMEQKLVGKRLDRPSKNFKIVTSKISGTIFRPYTRGIPGLPPGHPEAILVNQYVSWVGDNVRFGHNHIREANLFVDLFDLTHWQLIEAKAVISREAIRMALGQLKDYKRFYNRTPSLAVLLPSRPNASCVKLLTDNHISVIWRNSGGSFSTKRWAD